jgi:hypothetical protein
MRLTVAPVQWQGFLYGQGWQSKVAQTNCKDVAGLDESGAQWGSCEVVRVFLKGSEYGTEKVQM